MGQSFTRENYNRLKLQPDLIAGLDIDTINNQVFTHMINDPCDYSELHIKMQTFLSMSDERLIMTAKRKNVSLMPLINAVRDNIRRVSLLAKIADYGILKQEYYNTYPLYVVHVISDFITLHRNTYDFRERMLTKFNFKYFSHSSILTICKKIKFDGEYLNRTEDLLIEQFRDQITSMFKYLRRVNSTIPKNIVFKMIEGFYKKSSRLVPTLSETRVRHTTYDYPFVPLIPDEDLEDIITMLRNEYSWSRSECKRYLRIPLDACDEDEPQIEMPIAESSYSERSVDESTDSMSAENNMISQIDSFIREQNKFVQQ